MMSAEAFQSELSSNELLLWSGQPERSVIFHREDLLAIPFSLMWGGFAIFWEVSVLGFSGFVGNDRAPWFFVAWGIPFVVIGQYMIWGRFIHVVWKKSRTFYAVTGKRILLRTVSKGSSSNLKMVELSAVGQIEKSIRSDGIGTLQFGQPSPSPHRRSSFSLDLLEKNGAPAFVDIADVEMVYRIIMDAKERQDHNQTTAPAFGFSRRN